MKWFPVITLILLMSCNEKIPNYKKKAVVETQHSEAVTQANTFKGISHLSPRIKLDTERQEIEITGHSGQLCGIDFLNGQVLRYQLLSESELEIVLENETLKLTRIHKTEDKGIYGDWQNVMFSDDEDTNRERIVTFFIRDSEIMNVDVYCEEKAGKLFQEFQ